MDWKVKLEGDDNTFTQLQQAYTNPEIKITRDGVRWFLESSDFEPMSDHLQVRERAAMIVQAIVQNSANSGGQVNIGMSDIYRIHYDNSKTVFRADAD